ncbi:MAG: flippase-like domain-containing protein [Candidatus Aminicenantes bacterium]|nr:MAG: flippase-like domain-containing protein [Candidatus Aminicenantes bacterium]
MKKKYLRYALGILITALALWLSFRNLDWETLKTSFLQVNVIWVVLAIVNILLSVYIVGWRWQILLESKAHIPLSDMFRYNIISQYVNIIIPARFGELLKAWLASRKYSLSGSYVLGTVLIEKMIESFLVIVLAVLAPVFYTFKTKLKGHTIAIVIFLILIPLLILVIWKREWVRKQLARLANLFPTKLKKRILDFLDKGMEAFALLKDIKMILQVVLITIIVIFSQVITNLILFKAYGFQLSIFEALILQVVILIGMSLPSVPGKIGIFEYTVLLGLSMFGIEESIALGYGLMLHVIAYLPKILLGFVFTANLNISLKKAETEIELNELKADTSINPNPNPKGES